MKIISARITPLPKSLFDSMPKVYITLDSGEEKFLYEYYPDEISFTESEFIGLTEAEAISLKTKKDKKYIQS